MVQLTYGINDGDNKTSDSQIKTLRNKKKIGRSHTMRTQINKQKEFRIRKSIDIRSTDGKMKMHNTNSGDGAGGSVGRLLLSR